MKKIVVIFLFFFCTNVFAEPIKQVVFFGDSLSDDGNLYSYLKILPKSPPYFLGRFSNGPTWAEHIGDYYYKKSYAAYSNYSYGGATAILHHLRTDSFVAPVILSEEIESYLLRTKNKDRSHTLFGLWIGANDYLYERTENINKLTDKVVAKMMWAVSTILDNGGKRFFILNLPDLSQIPFAHNNHMEERLGIISQLHNEKLAEAVKTLQQQYPDVDIMYVDIYSIFLDILKHPDVYNKKYGTHVTNITDSCWLGDMIGRDKSFIVKALIENKVDKVLDKKIDVDTLSDMILASPSLHYAFSQNDNLEPCVDPDNYLFWDDMHPTAVIHGVLGSIMIEALDK
jgi:phospholipase/lecithinase/hemolysin